LCWSSQLRNRASAEFVERYVDRTEFMARYKHITTADIQQD